MHHSEVREVAELLLSAAWHKPRIGIRSSFLFSTDGKSGRTGGLGAEVYFDSSLLAQTALRLLECGPWHLKQLSLKELSRSLSDVFRKNYSLLADHAWGQEFEHSYKEQVDKLTIDRFANALAKSELLQPPRTMTFLPLSTVLVDAEFNTDLFSLVAINNVESAVPEEVDLDLLRKHFSFLFEGTASTRVPTCWLGIESPTIQSVLRIRGAICGALALKLPADLRYSFSQRSVDGSYCTFRFDNGQASCSTQAPHTPALMSEVVIGERDKPWLADLATMLRSDVRATRRQIKALEYFYKAWSLDPSFRFAVLCMVLDALYGNSDSATASVVSGIQSTVGDTYSPDRLRSLTSLRASIVHEGSPEIFDSSKYSKHLKKYGIDPLLDLESVVADCLREHVFGGRVAEQSVRYPTITRSS